MEDLSLHRGSAEAFLKAWFEELIRSTTGEQGSFHTQELG